jgi:hypothetical protein
MPDPDTTSTVGEIDGAISRAVTLADDRLLVVHLTDEGVIFDLFGDDDDDGPAVTVGATFDEWADLLEGGAR